MTIDIYFGNNVALCHFNGTDGATTFTDVMGHTFTATGAAQIDTAQSVFGGASALFPGTAAAYISAPDSDDFDLPADFTIELRFRIENLGTAQNLLMKASAVFGTPSFVLEVTGGNSVQFSSTTNGSTALHPILTFGTVAADTWYTLAVTREGNTMRAYLDGVIVDTDTASGTMFASTHPLYVGGSSFASGAGNDLWIEELRITKGVARYNANYTPATEAFSDTPPPVEAIVSMMAMTAEGSAPSGISLFAPMSAVGSGPIAATGLFAPMSASALPGVTGSASFQPLAAEVRPGISVAVALQPMSATGDGSSGSNAETQYTEFKALDGAGQGSAGSVAEGDGAFPALDADANTSEFVDISFEAMAAEGTGLTGGVSSADVQFRPAEAAVASIGGSLSVGRAQFTLEAAAGTSLQAGISLGAASFRRMLTGITALVGGAGAGAALFEALLASGQSTSPSVSVGYAAHERMVARATAYPLLTDEFRTFVMNTGGNALTEYQSYPFNSYAELGGRFYGAGPSGVFALDGTTDAGQDIAWTVRTGLMDDKDAMLKRLDTVLMSARFDGPMRLRVWTDENTYFDYNVANHRANVMHQVRAKLGKGLRSRFYRVELFGLNNTSAEINTMQLPMQPLTRRVG